jgi:hypothetical protein
MHSGMWVNSVIHTGGFTGGFSGHCPSIAPRQGS